MQHTARHQCGARLGLFPVPEGWAVPPGEGPGGCRREAQLPVRRDQHVEVRQHLPARAGNVAAVDRVDAHDGGRLGEAVGADDGHPELLGEGASQRLRERGAPRPRLAEAAQCAGCDVVGVDEAVQQRGWPVPHVHLLALDPLGDALRVRLVHQHRRAPRRGAEQRGEHHQVEDGARQVVALAQVGAVAARCRDDRGRQQQVALRVHRALRSPGRAARVRERGGRVGIDGREIPRWCGRLDARPPLVRREGGYSGDAVAVGEEARGAGVLEQVGLLGRGEGLVDAHPHRAHAHRAVERRDDVDLVGQAHRDPVAGAHAEIEPDPCGTRAQVVELLVCPTPAASDECLVLRVAPEHRREAVGDSHHLCARWRHVRRALRHSGARPRPSPSPSPRRPGCAAPPRRSPGGCDGGAPPCRSPAR